MEAWERGEMYGEELWGEEARTALYGVLCGDDGEDGMTEIGKYPQPLTTSHSRTPPLGPT